MTHLHPLSIEIRCRSKHLSDEHFVFVGDISEEQFLKLLDKTEEILWEVMGDNIER